MRLDIEAAGRGVEVGFDLAEDVAGGVEGDEGLLAGEGGGLEEEIGAGGADDFGELAAGVEGIVGDDHGMLGLGVEKEESLRTVTGPGDVRTEAVTDEDAGGIADGETLKGQLVAVHARAAEDAVRGEAELEDGGGEAELVEGLGERWTLHEGGASVAGLVGDGIAGMSGIEDGRREDAAAFLLGLEVGVINELGTHGDGEDVEGLGRQGDVLVEVQGPHEAGVFPLRDETAGIELREARGGGIEVDFDAGLPCGGDDGGPDGAGEAEAEEGGGEAGIGEDGHEGKRGLH